jgi:hypothetical protein
MAMFVVWFGAWEAFRLNQKGCGSVGTIEVVGNENWPSGNGSGQVDEGVTECG